MKKIVYLFAFLATVIAISACNAEKTEPEYIMTVRGKINADEIGMTLSHEHIVTDFTGAEKIEQPQYIDDFGVEMILQHLTALKEKGILTMFECTPNYIGRDVKLLKRLSELSGVNIVTNTGYYAAVDKKYLPAHVYSESAESIAQRWEREWTEGIEGTGIKPGFIKIGVGQGELDSIEVKLLKAAIMLSKKSGLTIAIHTGDGKAALDEYEILNKEGLRADKMIWVHAQNGSDAEREMLGKKGVWISLDGINEAQIGEYASMIKTMKEKGLLSRLLISHDDGWSVENNDGKVNLVPFGNGNSTPYSTLFDKLLDELFKLGFTQDEINQVLIDNPGKAMAISPVLKF